MVVEFGQDGLHLFGPFIEDRREQAGARLLECGGGGDESLGKEASRLGFGQGASLGRLAFQPGSPPTGVAA